VRISRAALLRSPSFLQCGDQSSPYIWKVFLVETHSVPPPRIALRFASVVHCFLSTVRTPLLSVQVFSHATRPTPPASSLTFNQTLFFSGFHSSTFSSAGKTSALPSHGVAEVPLVPLGFHFVLPPRNRPLLSPFRPSVSCFSSRPGVSGPPPAVRFPFLGLTPFPKFLRAGHLPCMVLFARNFLNTLDSKTPRPPRLRFLCRRPRGFRLLSSAFFPDVSWSSMVAFSHLL